MSHHYFKYNLSKIELVPLSFPAGEQAVIEKETFPCGLCVTQHSALNLTGSQHLSVHLAVILILCL